MTEDAPGVDGESRMLVLHVRPDTQEWGREDDDRWRSDLAELQRLLSHELPAETEDPGTVDNARGPAEISDVILALGSAGAMTAAVEIFKTWVGARPGRRRVKVAVEEAGVEQRSVLVEADGLGAAELHDLAARALGGNRGDPPAGEARDG